MPTRCYYVVLPCLAASTVFAVESTDAVSRPPDRVPESVCGGVEFPIAGKHTSQEGSGSTMRRGPAAAIDVRAGRAPCTPPLRRQDVFAWEDTTGLLLTDYSNEDFFALKVAAVNALVAARGDNFHFIGFFTNFLPHHQHGVANYGAIVNDVAGIGVSPTWNYSFSGLFTDRIEGFITLYDVNYDGIAPGAGTHEADVAQHLLAHEFEHRFGLFLPPLLGGRILNESTECPGFNGSHWNPRVDGQGGALHLGEWIGTNPAIGGGDCINPDGVSACRNTDIPGGHFSYTDLYLMGYASAAEMDAGNSELRYMNDACSAIVPYFGPISTFSSADIIAAAGPRIPTPLSSRKHYRAAWVMIHQPDDPPSNAERDKAIGMLQQMTIDWALSTLGRGTIGHSLSTDCNCNGVADEVDIAVGTSGDCNSDAVPDECGEDCNTNGQQDLCEIAAGLQSDCNMNGVPDGCELAGGEVVLLEEGFNGGLPAGWAANGVFHVSGACNSGPGCNTGQWAYAGRDSSCRLFSNDGGELVLPSVAIPQRGAILRHCSRLDSTPNQTYAEVRVNGEVIQRETGGSGVWETRTLDLSDFSGQTIALSFNLFTGGFASDRTGWQIDNVTILSGKTDCNTNGVPDDCDVAAGVLPDCTLNRIADVCELLPDCNVNGRADFNDLCDGTAPDCNGNDVPDCCDVTGAVSEDCNGNIIPDECETDCNFNSRPDDCDRLAATSFDCDKSGVIDECENGPLTLGVVRK